MLELIVSNNNNEQCYKRLTEILDNKLDIIQMHEKAKELLMRADKLL